MAVTDAAVTDCANRLVQLFAQAHTFHDIESELKRLISTVHTDIEREWLGETAQFENSLAACQQKIQHLSLQLIAATRERNDAKVEIDRLTAIMTRITRE